MDIECFEQQRKGQKHEGGTEEEKKFLGKIIYNSFLLPVLTENEKKKWHKRKELLEETELPPPKQLKEDLATLKTFRTR